MSEWIEYAGIEF